MKKLLILLALSVTSAFLSLGNVAYAQEDNRIVTGEVTLLSPSRVSVLDEFISDQLYTGKSVFLGYNLNLRSMYKKQENLSWDLYYTTFNRSQTVEESGEVSRLSNPANSQYLKYTLHNIGYGTYYHWQFGEKLKIKAGGVFDLYGAIKNSYPDGVNNAMNLEGQIMVKAKGAIKYGWDFKNWGLDITPHRAKMEKREMDKEFKDADNPFRIVFVCAMWLTGFDVKSLATIYIDKPLKAHTLMQTIARANRVCEGKSNGLIVDYIGVVKALRKALADYTGGKGEGQGGDPTPDKSELLAKITETIDSIEIFMLANGFNLKDLVAADDFAKLALVKKGANAMCATDEIKKRFEIQARELFRMFKYVERGELSEESVHYKNAISAVYDLMQEKRKHADNSALMAEINEIVSEHIPILLVEPAAATMERPGSMRSVGFSI